MIDPVRDHEPVTRIFNGTLNSDYCMDWPEIRDLRDRGHEIGCHTLTHTKLGPKCERSLQEELVVSRDRLAELSKFSYPTTTQAKP